jgi:acyl-CoA thioesterase FadM
MELDSIKREGILVTVISITVMHVTARSSEAVSLATSIVQWLLALFG